MGWKHCLGQAVGGKSGAKSKGSAGTHASVQSERPQAAKLQCRALNLFSCQLLLILSFVRQWGASNLPRSDAAAFHLRFDWVELKSCIDCKNNVCTVCTACRITVLHVIRAGAKLTSPVNVLYWMLTWLAMLSTWHCLYAGYKHWSFTIHYKRTLNLNKSGIDGLFTMVL